MSRTLCERKQDLKHDLRGYVQLICPANFVCGKCGRAASNKQYLCDPVKIGAPARSPSESDAMLEWLSAVTLRAGSDGR
jgi:hypothetical protein